MAFYSLDPWDGLRTDVGAAVVARTIGEANRNKEKSPEPFTLADFLFDWLEAGLEPEGGIQDRQQVAEAGDAWCALLATRRLKRGNDDRQPGPENLGPHGAPETAAGGSVGHDRRFCGDGI